MKDVLLRHYPELGPALEGMPNAFLPWHKVPTGQEDGARDKVRKRFQGVRKAAEAINA